jgi:hypothetical protein
MTIKETQDLFGPGTGHQMMIILMVLMENARTLYYLLWMDDG